MSDKPSGDATTPEVAPADPSSPRAAGVPIPLLAAALVAAAALGMLAGMRIGKALAAHMEAPNFELLKVPCEDCRKRREADLLAHTSAADVEDLIRQQTAVERAGADD